MKMEYILEISSNDTEQYYQVSLQTTKKNEKNLLYKRFDTDEPSSQQPNQPYGNFYILHSNVICKGTKINLMLTLCLWLLQ